MQNTKESIVQGLRDDLAAKAERIRAEIELVNLLPDDLPTKASFSNIRQQPKDTDENAWLSFYGPSYDPEKTFKPVEVLASLERGGFELVPASLCKWDNYREHPEPGYTDDIPDEKGKGTGLHYHLTTVEPIAPFWIDPNQHTRAEFKFYTHKVGKLFRVSIRVPELPVYLMAERQEYRGGWHYKPGSARLNFPKHWHSLQDCTIHKSSRAYRDTEQGLSGAIYFQPHNEQNEWKLTASEFLAVLLKPEVK